MSDFTPNEEKIIRHLHRRYMSGAAWFTYNEAIPSDAEITQEEFMHLLGRLYSGGFLIKDEGSPPTIAPSICDLVEALDNPPPPDYRDKLSKWFWSKRWSIGVYLLVVGVPAAVGYIVMLKTILQWFGIIKGGSAK